MKWERYRQSSNVEDRRGQGLGGRGIGIGTVIVALIGGLLFGVDPLTMLSLLSGGGAIQEQGPAPAQWQFRDRRRAIGRGRFRTLPGARRTLRCRF